MTRILAAWPTFFAYLKVCLSRWAYFLFVFFVLDSA
jgi:hypothetical protein